MKFALKTNPINRINVTITQIIVFVYVNGIDIENVLYNICFKMEIYSRYVDLNSKTQKFPWLFTRDQAKTQKSMTKAEYKITHKMNWTFVDFLFYFDGLNKSV